MVAKRILPWFGGSAAVWSTCLVFFQSALLLGYFYARLLTRLRPSLRATVHIIVLAASLALMPIGPSPRWKPGPTEDPSWQILGMLTATLGLPFIALSATSPLLQDWLARGGYKMPYRLFGVSNFASLAALLAYPLLIEPRFDIRSQSIFWSGGYVIFAALCAAAAWLSRIETAKPGHDITPAETVNRVDRAYWFSLAACGSMLLLSVTNHFDENVAAVPLFWVLPLAIYLLTFIISFGALKIGRRTLWLRLLAISLGILGYVIYDINSMEPIQVGLAVFLASLFACCMFCHGELARIRPHASALTSFYLLISAGGAAGAIFVGLIAPRIFNGIYELPVTLVFTALLATLLTWREGPWLVRLFWTGVAVAMVVVLGANVSAYRKNSLSMRRSFYGSLRVVQSPHAGPMQTRTLYHGTIEHGAELLLPPGRQRPTTYYGPDSGIGIVLRECFTNPKRVGIVGLGAGTIAAYGKPGDIFRFYDINQQVIDIARSLFFYLRESRAQIDTVLGDARLSLERETGPPYDVLALDAFSGDAIPVHLLTREAVALYTRRLKADGVLAFHVSNNYLDLAPVVQQLADASGYRAVLARNHANEDELVLASDWMLVTNNSAVLENAAVKLHSQPVAPRPGLRLWTDDFNNLLQILKTPHIAR